MYGGDCITSLASAVGNYQSVCVVLQLTVKKTLATFKRTHLDSWHDHKQKFSDDQLLVLTELLVSPNYYA